MIIGQAFFQTVVSLLLYFGAPAVLAVSSRGSDNDGKPLAKKAALEKERDTLVFNTFVWMQIFNLWNNRRLDNGLAVWEGAHRNPWLLCITALAAVGQVVIVQWSGKAVLTVPLSALEWIITVYIALCVFPVMVAIRKTPDALAARLVPTRVPRRGLAPAWSEKTDPATQV